MLNDGLNNKNGHSERIKVAIRKISITLIERVHNQFLQPPFDLLLTKHNQQMPLP